MPKISVVIPVYNSEITITETLESALNQTFKDFEIIVVNDGSQDKTLAVIASIQDPRLKVFSYSNAGASASRNRGFSHAVGEFISFLDADDLWTANKLADQFKALQENPKAAVAYSWTDCIDEFSNFLRSGSHLSISGNIYGNMLLGNVLENGSNALIRRQALMEVGGYDESLPAGQDWDLYLRLAASYEFIVIPSVQVLYRVSGNSISSNVSNLELANLQLLDKAFADAPEYLQYLKPYSLGNAYKYLTYKALEGYEKQRSGLIALKFIFYSICNDRALLNQKSLIVQLLIKSIALILLSPKQSQMLFKRLTTIKKFEKLPNINTVLLEFIKIEPSELSSVS